MSKICYKIQQLLCTTDLRLNSRDVWQKKDRNHKGITVKWNV